VRRLSEPRPENVSSAAPLDGRHAAILLAWTLVFAYSFAPFDFTLSPRPVEEPSGLTAPAGLADAIDLFRHLLAFVAVGAVHRIALRSKNPRRHISVLPLIVGLLFCVAIEVGQLFLPGRHAELVDLGINAFGLMTGYFCAPASLRAGTGVGWRPRLQPSRLRTGFIAVWGFSWAALLVLPAPLVTLDRWDPGYHLLIGNEEGGERPWEGEIAYVAFYGRALEDEGSSESFARPPGMAGSTTSRLRMGLLAAYDFTRQRELVVKAEGPMHTSNLQLELGTGSRWKEGNPAALVLDEGALLRSEAPAGPLSAALASGDAFSVEVWCRPVRRVQTGPARIAGISDGIWRRNFSLGQEGSALVFRVRNGLNGPNGSAFELRVPEAVFEDMFQVIATYDRGVSSLFRNGRRFGPTMDLREPSLLLGLGTTPASRFVVALLAALTLIAGISWLPGRSEASNQAVQLLLTAYAFLLLPLAVSLFTSFRPATSLHLWFGPMVALCWVALQRRGPPASPRPALGE